MTQADTHSGDILAKLGVSNLEELTPAARLFASLVRRNHVAVLTSSAAELSRIVGVSDATIIRSVRALGFDGLPEFKQALAMALSQTTARPARDMDRTLAEIGEGAHNGIAGALTMFREAASSLDGTEIEQRLINAVALLAPARSIAVFGIGPTAHLARYAVDVLGRAGRPAYALDASGIALAAQLLSLSEGQALLAMAYGTAYPEITATIEEAHRLGLPIVMISDSDDALMTSQADVLVPVKRGMSGRVALHGSTLAALEAIALGLASCDHARTMGSFLRLSDLRRAVTGS